jgi:hypothetical protein
MSLYCCPLGQVKTSDGVAALITEKEGTKVKRKMDDNARLASKKKEAKKAKAKAPKKKTKTKTKQQKRKK